MQRTNAVNLHRSGRIFSVFERDMEILPSYTPLFLVDTRGRVVENRKLNMSKGGFSNIISEVCEEDRAFFVSSHGSKDAVVVRAVFGDGKDYIVVSKDSDGFSRCVVCSLSENNCMHLHEYYEKLSCYKDYLDSFSSLVFSCAARTPVLRMFRTRINGTAELLRLTEGKAADKMLRFPFDIAAGKLCDVAKAMHRDAGSDIFIDIHGEDVVINAPESFFKLVLCLMAYGLRCSRSGEVSLSAKEIPGQQLALISLSAKEFSDESEIYIKALSGAFERAGLPFKSEIEGNEMVFSFVSELAREREEVLSDSAVIAREITGILLQEGVFNMYSTVADI